MIQQIAEMLSKRISDVPPLNLRMAAMALNIRVVSRRTHLRTHHGSLVPVVGGFEAVIFTSEEVPAGNTQSDLRMPEDSDLTLQLPRRGRFTLAHEIGHALFYSLSRDHVPRRITHAPTRNSPGHWREEGLCHAFARALLIPSMWGSAVGAEPRFETLIEASSLFRVSGEALIHRLLYDWHKWSNVVVIQISFSESTPRVRVFRGVERVREKTFTRAKIENVIRGAATPLEAANFLVMTLGLPERSVLARRLSVWAIA
ncbi:MAG TPA: ImmA/IrrE family metallo-endopeptidase [Longimicrobium sp.]|jgi:hypothetical protein|uniref:ImmA/IrrE family metallo-endopeptidase n=1 Tax=Longimicrobium sp. TaxID=2029185 RepID=UPI002ED94492